MVMFMFVFTFIYTYTFLSLFRLIFINNLKLVNQDVSICFSVLILIINVCSIHIYFLFN